MIKSLIMLALAAAPASEPAPPRCVTKRQVADAAMSLTPYLVDAVTRKCRAHLPATSFLVANGAALHARLAAEGAGREASAAQVLIAMMGKDVPPIEDSESLVKVMGAMASGFIAKDIPVGYCTEISGMVEAVAPLPAENIGLFAASVAGLIGQAEKGSGDKPGGAKVNGKFEICKDG